MVASGSNDIVNMLAWGKYFMPFSNLFINYFPGYNKFRAVTMTLVIADFAFPFWVFWP